MLGSRKDSHKDFLRSQGVIQRRKRKQLVGRLVRLFLLLALVIALFYSMWLDQLAIHKVVVVGTDPSVSDEINASATGSLLGTYFRLVPRKNALFYPKRAIEADILSAHPQILSVSLGTDGFDILNIKVVERQPVMKWCSSMGCYLLDDQAFAYATTTPEAFLDAALPDVEALASASTASSSLPVPLQDPVGMQDGSEPSGMLVISGGPLSTSTNPIGRTAFDSQSYKTMLYLASDLASSSLPVVSVKYEDADTIDFVIRNNGQIILSGRNDPDESVGNVTAALKSSVFSTSTKFQYIDARFGNKVFYRLAQ